MDILLSSRASDTLDRVYTDRSIYNSRQQFTPWFIQWNNTFHQYVRESVLDTLIPSHGVFAIGRLGVLTYSVFYVGNKKCFVIEEFHFPTFRFTSRHVPPVAVSKSPRFWPKPRKTPFNCPPKMRILKGDLYGGVKIGYLNRRYIILKADGTPLAEKWFDKRPLFFRQPFGKYNIIAYASYFKSLYAVCLDGHMLDMHKSWDDVYLDESIAIQIDHMITDALHRCLRSNINESRCGVSWIHESQIVGIVQEIVKKLVV